jgi:hypothetical protein
MKILPLDSYSPRIPLLRAKRAELHVEKAQKIAECAIIRQRTAEEPNPGNAHDRRVAEILGEKPVAVSLPDTDKLRVLQQEIEAINAAISILDSEIQKETRIANNKLIESVSPELTRLGNAFAKAFADLHAAHLEFDDYIDDLENVGASVGQFRIRPNGLSHPKDLSGSYAYGLAEFIDSGFFSKSNMPKVLK